MECEQIAQLLPDYLQGDLRPDQQHDVEAHLKQCADCAEEIVLWEKLFLLPIEQQTLRLAPTFKPCYKLTGRIVPPSPGAIRHGENASPPGTPSAGFMRP